MLLKNMKDIFPRMVCNYVLAVLANHTYKKWNGKLLLFGIILLIVIKRQTNKKLLYLKEDTVKIQKM